MIITINTFRQKRGFQSVLFEHDVIVVEATFKKQAATYYQRTLMHVK